MEDDERDQRIEALLNSEPAVAQITPDFIEKMLRGFELAPQQDFGWFAQAIRPAVWIAARGRIPPGNAEMRDDLSSIASRLRELFLDIKTLHPSISEELLQLASELEGPNPEYRQKLMLAAYHQQEVLVHLAWFIEILAARLDRKKQPPKWRSKARRDARIKLAIALSPVFERGFQRKATLNKWRMAAGEASLGPWADFFQRVVSWSLSEKATPDLEGVLTDAAKKLRESGYSAGNFMSE